MRHYENLVIVKPTLTEEEIQSTIAGIEEVITSNGGTIIARDPMGMRKLAYPIEKNVRGYFHIIYYTIDPTAILEIERRFRINEELLRYVTIKYDSKREVTAWQGMVDKIAKRPAAEPRPETAPEPTDAPEAAAPAAEETAPTAEEAVPAPTDTEASVAETPDTPETPAEEAPAETPAS